MNIYQSEFKFYVYAYLREDKTPYYIGKGCNNRAFAIHSKNAKKPKNKSRIIFLYQNLTEEQAFFYEIYFIKLYGRKDIGTGILRNLTDGGKGTKRVLLSDSTRQKMSDNMKKRIRKPFTEEQKQNMRKPKSEQGRKNIAAAVAKINRNGHNNPAYGLKREDLSERNKKGHTKESIEKLKQYKGEKSSSYGKFWWNDGTSNIFAKEAPSNFVKGRLLFKKT
jgi:hypothetical protein